MRLQALGFTVLLLKYIDARGTKLSELLKQTFSHKGHHGSSCANDSRFGE
jgi:hypothetical protein